MALHAGMQVNGTAALSPAKENELYAQLLRLQDAVIAGKHPHFTLPPAAIEQLKTKLAALSAPAESAASSLENGIAYNANAATNNSQQLQSPRYPDLPGLQFSPQSHGQPSPALALTSGLNPIFLEKSDSLVKAESLLKRQRLERDLQGQFDHRKHSSARDRDHGADIAPSLDVDVILSTSLQRATHLSGLKPVVEAGSDASSSFDENDYYSSLAQSDWSSPASASKGSDRAADALTADAVSLEGPSAQSSFTKSTAAGKQPACARDLAPPSAKLRPQIPAYQIDDDEDDEYTPPDAAAVDNFGNAIEEGQINTEDDDEDYEPGEITQEIHSTMREYIPQHAAQPSPKVPVIRNHLTHIAAPQPNRVSPLAVAKGPSLEMELVNGRPEVVNKSHHAVPSRVSSASPTNVVNGGKKARRTKKRKEVEPSGLTAASTRKKRKRDRMAAAQSPPSPSYLEPRIKDEPMSPPPFTSNLSDAPQYGHRLPYYRPADIDLVTPQHTQPPRQHVHEAPLSGLRYEYALPTSPTMVSVASPSRYRPAHRDSQDLRRIASLQYAQHPVSPAQRTYSPAPYRTVSASYADARATQPPVELRYQEALAPEHTAYVRDRSSPRLQGYHDQYGRATSPAMMPPPAGPPRRIVMDQYGNRYYAADPETGSQISVPPTDKRPPPESAYERAPSRMASSYATPVQYQQANAARMAPPPPLPPQISDEQAVRYVDANGYPIEYRQRPNDEIRYMEVPTSAAFQPAPSHRYEPMPPAPAAPVREQTSPVYAASARAFTAMPETAAPPSYARQASVAPAQYARRDAPPSPARAMSVLPGYEQPRAQSFAPAPQAVRYVDQYGREIRQVPANEYRYQ